MREKVKRIIKNYKNNLSKRLENDGDVQDETMLTASPIHYDISGKIQAISCGGIGLVHNIVNAIGLPEEIDNRLHLLKQHRPYHESDHVLTIAYNIIAGGTCLEDLELLRNNSAYMDCLGAERIPDPTTAGDFLRRFTEEDINMLMKINNDITVRMWNSTLSKNEKEAAIIDIDGTIQQTYGECKEGMDMSYKGVWGFSPLAITEATTGVHLAIVNRPGNKLSQDGADVRIDKAIRTAGRSFKKIYLRGDSAFSLTWKFDEWSEKNTQFIFGYDNRQNLQNMAENLPKNAWKRIMRKDERPLKRRKRKKRIKKSIVIQRGYETITQKDLFVAEFNYRPTKCAKEYRIIAVKKIIDVTQGQHYLFEDKRYFFYITNIRDFSPTECVRFIHGRCNHENKIEQLDNGIHALKMPAAEFLANCAYMAIVSLAWNIKSYIGLLIPDKSFRHEIIAAEFKSFQNKLIQIPCQIVRSGRQIVFRFLNYTKWVDVIFSTLKVSRHMTFART